MCLLPFVATCVNFQPSMASLTNSKQNPKSEARNPKQTRSQINLKSEKFQTLNSHEAHLVFCIWYYLNLFRISDFVLRVFVLFSCAFFIVRAFKYHKAVLQFYGCGDNTTAAMHFVHGRIKNNTNSIASVSKLNM